MSSCGSTIVLTTPPVLAVDEHEKPLRALIGPVTPFAEVAETAAAFFLAVVLDDDFPTEGTAEPLDASSFSFWAIS